MDLLKALRAANASVEYLPAVPLNNKPSPTLGIDMATGINPFGLTGFMYEIFPEENPKLLREGYKNNHIVFSIVDWKAQKMSEATPILYRIKSKKHYEEFKAYQKKGQNLEALVARVKGLEEVDNHPLLKILRKPNKGQTWGQFVYATSVYWDFGNALIYGHRLGTGENRNRVISIHSLPPHIYVGENPSSTGYYAYQHVSDPAVKLLGTDVNHLKRFNPDQGYMGGTLWGMSKLTPGRALLAKSKNTIEAEAELMGNRGGRFIIFPKSSHFNKDTNVTVDAKKGREATDAIRKKLSQVGANGVAANPFELGHIDLSMSSVDLNIVESNRVTKEDFCAMWRVDPLAVFSSTTGTFANAAEAIRYSLISGVLPDLNELAAELTEFLTPAFGDDLVIDFDTDVYPELQPDKKAIAEYIDSIPLTGDERRLIFKWGATNLPEMQIHLIKNNLSPMRDFLAPEAEEPPKDDKSYPE